MTRVAITTLGCKTNQFESAAMIETLRKEGFAVVPFDGQADVYLINTCTVTARTDAESRKLIRRASRRNPGSRIVVTGCYAQVAPEQLAAMSEVELVIGNEEKRRLPEILKRGLTQSRVQVAGIDEISRGETLHLESFSEHTRAFLQIQNGCDSYCSYCIVPFARGRSRSVPQDKVMEGVARLSGEGYREIVLTGIHLGNYGRDLTPATSLLGLVMQIEQGGVAGRIRLGSIEPVDLTPELIEFSAGSKIICPHFHIPLQSGSYAVLARMNRGYDSRYFRRLVNRIDSAIPDVCIGFDVIAGFPGETDEEFTETLSLITELPAAYLHVFPFSSRPGTKAAEMPGHLPSRVVTERAERLRILGEQKRQEFYRRFVGRTMDVLVMQQGDTGLWSGMTGNYLTVRFAGEKRTDLSNKMVLVRVVNADNDGLKAELLH